MVTQWARKIRALPRAAGERNGVSSNCGSSLSPCLVHVPLLLRKRYPLMTVLIYWILFTYLPTQVLPFSYPVADRYLFLPSVGAVILIAWLMFRVADRLPEWNVVAATLLVTCGQLSMAQKNRRLFGRVAGPPVRLVRRNAQDK